MPPSEYSEKVGSVSPNSAGFGRDGGRAVMNLFVSSARIDGAIERILGTVRRGRDGRLKRFAPAAHPQYRWLLANRITNIVGIGKPTIVDAKRISEASALHLQYASYPTYVVTVEYVHQPFVSLPDFEIDVVVTNWVDEGQLNLNGLTRATRYATEYKRWVSRDYAPGVELVAATIGSQKFRTDVPPSLPPNTFPFMGAPRVYVPKNVLKLTWHYVPMSLVEDDNSPIIKYLGRVNQRNFVAPWGKTYIAGSLLYVGVAIKRYLPFIPASRSNPINWIAFENEYVCDVEFLFDYSHRIAENPPGPANGNWIPNGWNAKPWIGDRKFYYVTAVDPDDPTDIDTKKWVPTYLSFLVEWLFTDPIVL